MRAVLRALLAGLLLILVSASAARAASFVVDADSGAILHAESSTQKWYPASLTKVMTLYLVFEAIEFGRFKLSDKIPVSAEAARQPPTKLGLRKGQKIRVQDAIRAVILRSANDAAVVLAEAVDGSEARFARRMTQKAKTLGMSRTKFANASGLPGPGQHTTARDMGLLARAVIRDHPDYFRYFGERSFAYQKGRLPTINGWLNGFEGADGIKTGFTCASGYNIIGSARRNGRRLIAVVLGGKSSAARNKRLTELLSAAFETGKPGEGSPLRLAELTKKGGKMMDGPPPEVLSKGACSVASARSNGKLPGWGIIVGTYHSKADARATVKKHRASLRKVINGGRPAYVSTNRWGIDRHNALVVGLKKSDAGKACRHLRDLGAYCLALSPKTLNDPKAIWR